MKERSMVKSKVEETCILLGGHLTLTKGHLPSNLLWGGIIKNCLQGLQEGLIPGFVVFHTMIVQLLQHNCANCCATTAHLMRLAVDMLISP
jgi:hypothetical protein